MIHADRVIISLACGQGQLSRIWKVQCDWLYKHGKGMSSVEQAFVGRDEKRTPLKTLVSSPNGAKITVQSLAL